MALEIEQDLTFQQRQWHVQRVAWVSVTLLLVAALWGVLGNHTGTILRATAIYLGLLVIFRMAGKRTLAQITAFDFVLILVISESFQSALSAGDESLTSAFLIALTMIGLDIGLSLLKQRSKGLEKLLDDIPLVIVEDGKPLKERMQKVRVAEEDILSAARMNQGVERMADIKYAVLERSGGISIIHRRANEG
jgi:uncharacterized membrane protein YcaP (DUF421 family)